MPKKDYDSMEYSGKMSYSNGGRNKTTPPGGSHSPMGKLTAGQSTSTSGFIKSDKQWGINIPMKGSRKPLKRGM